MKSVAFAVGAFAAIVAAQDLISSLPQCGQVCAEDMVGAEKADELNCNQNDNKCLCQNPNFLYGFRDCSLVTCQGAPADAIQIVNYAIQLCSAAGVAITNSGGSATVSNTAGTNAGIVSTVLSTVTSDGQVQTTPVATTTINGGATSSSATGSEATGSSSNSGVVSTFTSDGNVITTTLPANGIVPLVSTITSDGSVITTTFSTSTVPSSSASGSDTSATNSVSPTSSGTESASSTSEGGDSTTTDGAAQSTGGPASTSTHTDAAMPQRTAAPGLIAAAGLAVLLL